jgi:hypothetical protein
MKELYPNQLKKGHFYYYIQYPESILQFIEIRNHYIKFIHAEGNDMYFKNTDGIIDFQYEPTLTFIHKKFTYGK